MNNNFKHKAIWIATITLFLGTFVTAQITEWNQWRGPNRDAIARDINLLKSWPEGGPKLIWKATDLGGGFSGVSLWGNKIFTMGDKDDGCYLFCINKVDGKPLWSTRVGEAGGNDPERPGPRCTPATDGIRVITIGQYGELLCADINTGKELWSKSYQNDFGATTVPRWNFSASALLDGDKVICLHGGPKGTMVALNKENGEIIWQKNRDEGTSWATPLSVEVDGKLQVVTNATNLVRSYDVETGEIIWECSGQTRNVIPSPVAGFGMVFCTSGYGGNKLQAIELGHTGTLNGTDAIKWEISSRTTPYIPSPLLYGDKIYIISNNRAILSCYNAETGKPLYESQNLIGAGGYYASPTGGGDKVYLASQNGVTIVVKNSDKVELLASNKLYDQFDASQAVVGDELFLKGKEYLYCIAQE